MVIVPTKKNAVVEIFAISHEKPSAHETRNAHFGRRELSTAITESILVKHAQWNV